MCELNTPLFNHAYMYNRLTALLILYMYINAW